MVEIARTGRWNPGGGRWLELLPITAVAAYSRASRASSPLITLTPNADWTRIYCAQETLQYRISADETDQGDVYTVEIKGFSPDDSSAKALAIDALFHQKKCLARFCDNSGLVRIAGTQTEGLQFSFDLTTDTTVGGSRGYALSLKGTLTASPAYG